MWHASTRRHLRLSSSLRRSRTRCREHGASSRAASPTALTSAGVRSASPAAGVSMRTTPAARATVPAGRLTRAGPLQKQKGAVASAFLLRRMRFAVYSLCPAPLPLAPCQVLLELVFPGPPLLLLRHAACQARRRLPPL